MSTQGAERALPGWSGPSGEEMDPEASLHGWVGAALAADEPELAQSLLGADESHRALRAEAMLLVGRAAEALEELRAMGVDPADDLITWAHAVMAAAHSANGDDRAWAWLLARAGDVNAESRLRLVRLIATAGDARGDLPVADTAWLEVGNDVVPSPRIAARVVVAEIARRNREGRAEDLGALFGGAHGLLRVRMGDGGDVTGAVLDAAAGLERRGDVAGAGLLLRTARSFQGKSPRLDDALRSRRLPMARSAAVGSVGLVAGAVVVVALVVLGALQGLGPIGLPIAIVLYRIGRVRPLQGLTGPESSLWRGLASLRYDPARDASVDDGDASAGWYGLAALIGTVAAAILTAKIPGAFVVDGRTPAWAFGGAALATWFALSLAGGAGAFLGARRAHRLVLHRRAQRRRSADRARAVADASTCACWNTIAAWGSRARLYAEQHLVDSPPGFTAETGNALAGTAPIGADAGAVVLHCPRTATPWLAGPIGRDGRWLVLKGATRPRQSDLGGSPDVAGRSTGFYL